MYPFKRLEDCVSLYLLFDIRMALQHWTQLSSASRNVQARIGSRYTELTMVSLLEEEIFHTMMRSRAQDPHAVPATLVPQAGLTVLPGKPSGF